MVTDEQVRLLRTKMTEGKTMVTAAASAGLSERSAYVWKEGALPSETKVPRSWRTRPDPFAAIWQTEVVPLLTSDEGSALEGPTILAELRRRHGEAYGAHLLRTLQRRLHEWRALHGPGKEVMFEQRHEPGREGSFDYTDASELCVTIAGEVFAHLFFQLVLSFSSGAGWASRSPRTFEALCARPARRALWELGGVLRVWRAATTSRPRRIQPGCPAEVASSNRRFAPRCARVDLRGDLDRASSPKESRSNGVAEEGPRPSKSALDQALLLRGSRDFATVTDYMRLVGTVRDRIVADKPAALLTEERGHLLPLPSTRLPEQYTIHTATVRQWSTIHFGRRVYSVPSRLIGCEVEVRQHPDLVEVFYRDRTKPTATMPRLRGDRYHQIDYRHVIWSLVRKPGAFARYRYREELFPSIVFRRAYDALAGRPRRARRCRVRAHPAPGREHHAGRCREGARGPAHPRRERPGLRHGQGGARRARETTTVAGCVHIPAPDLSVYDRLLGRRRRRDRLHHRDGDEAACAELLARFKLPTFADQVVRRFSEAGHDASLPTLLEVLEAEADEKRAATHRRTEDLLAFPQQDLRSRSDRARLPRSVGAKLDELATGDFLERAHNVLCFGLPGRGKTHAAAALGHALVQRGHPVLFAPTFPPRAGAARRQARPDPAARPRPPSDALDLF